MIESSMEDLAREIVTQLRIEDRESGLELVAKGIDYSALYRGEGQKFCNVLRVSAPVVNGKLRFVVDFRDTLSVARHDGEVLDAEWQTIEFDSESWEGVASFVEGFMGSGGRCDRLTLDVAGGGLSSSTRQHVCSWWLGQVHCPLSRAMLCRGAVLAMTGTRSARSAGSG
jgi:hypothetical protein